MNSCLNIFVLNLLQTRIILLPLITPIILDELDSQVLVIRHFQVQKDLLVDFKHMLGVDINDLRVDIDAQPDQVVDFGVYLDVLPLVQRVVLPVPLVRIPDTVGYIVFVVIRGRKGRTWVQFIAGLEGAEVVDHA